MDSPSNYSTGSPASYNYKADETLPRRMLLKMNKQRLENKYVDICIIVGSIKIPAHKVVLTAFSDYFEALLNYSMNEGCQNEIELQDLDGKAVEAIIEYAYTGEILICIENVEIILETANFLAVESIIEACCKFLKRNLNSENCINIAILADRYTQLQLKESALDCIVKNFTMIAHNEDIVSLPQDVFKTIIGKEDLLILHDNVIQSPQKQEQDILSCVLKYVKLNNLETKDIFVELMKLVRLPLLTEDNLKSLESSTLVLSNNDVANLVGEARKIRPKDILDDTCDWSRPRRAGICYQAAGPFASGGQVRPVISRFNDEDLAQNSFVSGMKIFTRLWDGRPVVGGFEMFYKNGNSSKHGQVQAGPNIEVHEFHLDHNQYIVKVEVNAGWLIDRLAFHTNTGNIFGPFGGNGGAYFTSQPPDQFTYGHLSYFKGAVVHTQSSKAITDLQLVWGYYEYQRNA